MCPSKWCEKERVLWGKWKRWKIWKLSFYRSYIFSHNHTKMAQTFFSRHFWLSLYQKSFNWHSPEINMKLSSGILCIKLWPVLNKYCTKMEGSINFPEVVGLVAYFLEHYHTGYILVCCHKIQCGLIRMALGKYWNKKEGSEERKNFQSTFFFQSGLEWKK